MPTRVTIPDGLWDTAQTPEGVLINWLYEDGAAVTAGAKLAEVMVEKTNFDISAPATGSLHITAKPDSVVVPGSLIGEIE
ncbi:biotin/lipoyl-containing protein [Varunaivibrio sulfuroxidans]|uniref:2-oxoglutarate dehydrogenase E2 component (Dihydrolipoamide succinyltransferase) n=1 Tax=Varunaivibrio sulfuroxidans TaxID=1773489 RepID=A0A4R3J4E1_9PROT|nr:lipoyl domain-containing protein [Varunaivibrio sulfuroxidans]TCS60678.1 2-oxoglutarate dehydrogenase E2 component (dihydrolipoamide succinyltransferase) [Varunaivibrio sulfuroxidans]WES30167.1 lipoyl domain-containing protein [Varunaivibrio sulfuroxidans]